MFSGRRFARSWSLPLSCCLKESVAQKKSNEQGALGASHLQSGHGLCLKRREPAATPGSLQECSSIGRAPVSKTGGRRFEPCHSCHLFKHLAKILDVVPHFPEGSV